MALLTLCFVQYKNKILMINRNKAPFMGMWNALGGHKEENETIEECAIREIFEESNIKVDNIKLISVSTWNFDDIPFYVYVSTLNDSFDVSKYPYSIDEGIVDFKDIDWLLDKKNIGIVPDLRLYIENIKNNKYQDYHLIYDKKGNLKKYILK